MTSPSTAAPAAEPPTVADAFAGRAWFSVRSATAYLDYDDEKTVRRAALGGRLQYARTAPATPGTRGGNLRFRREWLDRFAEGLPPLQAAAGRTA